MHQTLGWKICLAVLQNEWQSNILDRLYQIMLKIIILSQIRADTYISKIIFDVLMVGRLVRKSQRMCRRNIWMVPITDNAK